MKEKGQQGIESIAMGAAILVIIATVYLYVSPTVEQSISQQKVETAILKIESAARDVFIAGPGNRRVIDIELPGRIEAIDFAGNAVNIALGALGGGKSDFYAMLPVRADGSIPITKGFHDVVFQIQADGTLLVASGLTLTPSNIIETIPRGDSTIVLMTLTNFSEADATGNNCFAEGAIASWVSFQGTPTTIKVTETLDFNAIIAVPSGQTAGSYDGTITCTNSQGAASSAVMINVSAPSAPSIVEDERFPNIARYCKDSCGVGPYYAAIWADSNTLTNTVYVSASNQVVAGRTHSNNAIRITASNNLFTGGTTYVSSISDVGSNNLFDPLPMQVSVKTMPLTFNIADYAPGGSEALKAQADGNRYHYVSGDYKVSTAGTVLDGLYYVTGKVTLQAGSISGTYTMVSETEITASGANNNAEAYVDSNLLYFSNSSINPITLSGGGGVFKGIIYAPLNEVSFSGAQNNLIIGGIIAKKVSLSSGSNTVNGNIRLSEEFASIDASKVSADDGSGNPCTNENGYGKWVVDANIETYVEFNFNSFGLTTEQVNDANFIVNYATDSTAYAGQYTQCYNADANAWVSLNAWANTASCGTEATQTIRLDSSCYDTISEANNLRLRMGLNSSNTKAGNIYIDYAKARILYTP